MWKKATLVVISLLCTSIMTTACAQTQISAASDKEPVPSRIAVTGLTSEDILIDVGDLQQMPPFEGRAQGADSSGQSVAHNIKGAYLSDVFKEYGYTQSELPGLRIIASDGYSIEVSADILKNRDIILAYEVDGQPLNTDNAPVWVFIPEERAMYWVRMVTEINVIKAVQTDEVSDIYFLDTLYKQADYEDYELNGQTYKTLSTKKMLEDRRGNGGDTVIITSADGLQKNETLENFYKGAVNMEGDNAPEFFSSQLPEGMFVRDVVFIKHGGNALCFAHKLIKASGQNAMTLDGIAQACGLVRTKNLVITFADHTLELSADMLKDITLHVEGDGLICRFANGKQESGIISIETKP